MKKQYKITAMSGILATRTREYTGTLEELADQLKFYLNGVKPRKPETMVNRLNASQKGHEHEYTYKYFIIKEL